MNSSSEDSFQPQEDKGNFKPNQQGRPRLTLLSDLPEHTSLTRTNRAESPVRMYLRELQEQRLLLQKQNTIAALNKKQRPVDSKPERDNKQLIKPSPEEYMKKSMMSPTQDLVGASRQRHVKQKQNEQMKKPGIYLYRKTINLAEPAEAWDNLRQSYLRTSFESKGTNGSESYSQRKLFEQALRCHQKNR